MFDENNNKIDMKPNMHCYCKYLYNKYILNDICLNLFLMSMFIKNLRFGSFFSLVNSSAYLMVMFDCLILPFIQFTTKNLMIDKLYQQLMLQLDILDFIIKKNVILYKKSKNKKKKAKADALLNFLDFLFVFAIMLCIGLDCRITLLISSIVILLFQIVNIIKFRHFFRTYNLIVQYLLLKLIWLVFIITYIFYEIFNLFEIGQNQIKTIVGYISLGITVLGSWISIFTSIHKKIRNFISYILECASKRCKQTNQSIQIAKNKSNSAHEGKRIHIPIQFLAQNQVQKVEQQFRVIGKTNIRVKGQIDYF